MMKKLLLSLILTSAFSGLVICQSVQDVPATDAQDNPIINSLIKYVVADTNAQGQQLHDIYRLERGKYYFYNQSAVFNNPIVLEGASPGTDAASFPAKFLVQPNDDGSVPEEAVITSFADLTFKNLEFCTITTDNQYSWGNAIYLQKDGLRLELDSCYFDLVGWAFIEADGINHTTLIMRGCQTWNGSPFGGDEWVPFFFEGSGGSADTCIATNNTFYNIQGSVLNIEPLTPWKYIYFDHNTCVNIVQNFTTDVAAHLNSTFTNNIFYNVGCYGSRISDIKNGGGDTVQAGVIQVDTINTVNGQSVPADMPEKDRKLVVKNNVYFWSQGVHDYWTATADSIARIPWLSSRALQMFSDKTNYPNFVAENNLEADPGFTNFGGTDEMVAQMYNDRNTALFGFWGWYPYAGSDTLWALSHWPLPEDFSYSASFTSTDGYHVGSLQWYPNELAMYEQGMTDVKDGKNIAVPHEFSLKQNYPNPFNPSTTVSFELARSGAVTLSIYNTLGQKIKDIISNQFMSSGSHEVNITMAEQASGVYLLSLKQNGNVKSVKMLLMK
jgi:Secretion system C-terminal sorting domain